jgi:hypothetical protein
MDAANIGHPACVPNRLIRQRYRLRKKAEPNLIGKIFDLDSGIFGPPLGPVIARIGAPAPIGTDEIRRSHETSWPFDDLRDADEEILGRDRLTQRFGHSSVARGLNAPYVRMRRDEDNGYRTERLWTFPAQLSDERNAVKWLHVVIGNHEVRPDLTQKLQPAFSIGCFKDLADTVASQKRAEKRPHMSIIIDNDSPQFAHSLAGLRRAKDAGTLTP